MRSQKNRNLLRRLTHAFYLFLLLRLPFKNKVTRYKVSFLPSAFCFLLSAFCITAFTSCDKEETLMNRWNLQSVTMNGESLKDSSQYHLLTRYTDYVFFLEHSLNVETYANGQFTASADGYYKFSNSSTLEMSFTILNQKSKITAKIKKLTKKELHLEYTNKGNTYFLKLYTN